ncbi:hypothetical protein BpHYR1_000557 [Brachionus plicatilis]|uniref:Uncharacterized protein n=1 Tax=Brachionus plicatilis TaxID=10195 RepID=A0A3M7R3V9_BRAPC|nr:hypothetical protein BpHYR1_000557 [Brachionus plicatilis]
MYLLILGIILLHIRTFPTIWTLVFDTIRVNYGQNTKLIVVHHKICTVYQLSFSIPTTTRLAKIKIIHTAAKLSPFVSWSKFLHQTCVNKSTVKQYYNFNLYNAITHMSLLPYLLTLFRYAFHNDLSVNITHCFLNKNACIKIIKECRNNSIIKIIYSSL